MTRLAFTADLHVDEYGSRRDPSTGLNARLVDYLTTLRFVALDAAERGCAGLVVAGDFTERRHPSPWLVSRIRDALWQGPADQLYLRGNHDGEIAGGSIVTILEDKLGVPRNGVTRPTVRLMGDVAIAAIPYLDAHWKRTQPGYVEAAPADVYRALADDFLTIARGLYAVARRAAAATVLVCHQTLAGAWLSDSQQAFLGDQQLVVDAAQLSAIGFDLVVAGHLHKHQVVVPGDRPVLYAGSIERVDFGEEGEPKGYVVADVEPGNVQWEFVATPARRFLTVRGSWGELDDLEEEVVRGTIVRVVDLDPSIDVASVRAKIEGLGAFDLAEIRLEPRAQEVNGGISESLTPHEALTKYFADDPDRDALVERGRQLLSEAAV